MVDRPYLLGTKERSGTTDIGVMIIPSLIVSYVEVRWN